MKSSLGFVVLGALLTCGACFSESNKTAREYVADDVPIPAGAIKISVVEEPILKTISKEQTLVDDVALPQVFQEKLQGLADSSTNRKSSKAFTVKETGLQKIIEEIEAEDDVVLPQVYQEKSDPTKNQQISEAVIVEEPSLELAPKDEKFFKDMKVEDPSVKKTAEETAPKVEVNLPQDFEKERQDIPSSAQTQQTNVVMTVEKPVKKTTAERASEDETTLLQHLSINKENNSGPVETLEVKEQTDVPTISDKEHSSHAKTAKETIPEDEVHLPQVFEEVLKNQAVEEPALKIKTEEPAAKDVVALPPVLKMIMQLPSKSVYAFMITQQADEMVDSNNMLESEMRIPRQVQHSTRKDVHRYNNVHKNTDRFTDDSVDKRTVRRNQGVPRPHSNKRMSAKRRKVNPPNPNNWNAVRFRNVKKDQVMKNGQWVKNGQLLRNGQRPYNGQWVRKDQSVRRKKTNNQDITHRYNIENGYASMKPQNVTKRVKDDRRRKNSDINRKSSHHRPSQEQRKNNNRKQIETAIQPNHFANQPGPRPIIIIGERQRN